MNGMLPVDLSTLAGQAMAGTGGFALIIAGRWLLRAEAIASIIKTVGFVVILLGVGDIVGIVDINLSAGLDLVRAAMDFAGVLALAVVTFA